MQNWQTNGQAGSAQSHSNLWSGSYGFPDGSNQFDAGQSWSHQMPSQDAYQHINARGSSDENSPFGSSPHQGRAAIANDHNGLSSLNQGNFHNSHDQFAMDASYADPDQADPLAGLSDFPPDNWGQSGKANFAANIDNLGHSHTPDFAHQQFPYNGQTNQLFNGNVPQYNETQLMPQHGHQTSAQLQQRFEQVPQSYSPAPQGYTQSPQPHQVQPERIYSRSPHSYQVQHAHQQSNQSFSNPNPTFQQSQTPVYQQHSFVTQQMSQPMPYAQPATVPALQPVDRKQMAEPEPTPQHTPQPVPQPQPMHQVKALPTPARPIQPQPQPQLQPQLQPQIQAQSQPQPQSQPQSQRQQPAAFAAAPPISQPGTPILDSAAQPDPTPAKKRKRVTTKKEPEVEQVESPSDSTVKRADDDEILAFPSSTDEETMAMVQFKKRNAAAKKQFPAIPGASFLVSSGTVKMPAPKSYDRLAPLVALPSSSGKRILPELGPDLPCEIQGRFTDKYRPSMNFVGKPEDREMEAKPLIDQYQREMKSLGNRRPKYADYPFTFQEQLKADEAAKSKAQRKARKEEEEERKKPIRAESRPSDPSEAAVWDVLGIVYIDPSATRTNALIASAVQALGEFLIKLRTDVNRAKLEADQATKEKTPSGTSGWIQKMEEKKDTFAKVCEAAAIHGDEAVLENLGSHQKGILSLVNMLIGCIKAADFNGPLPKALLRFMSNISMSKKVAENVNFENVRKRLADRGDNEVKGLVRTIASRIKKDTEPSNGVDMKKTSSSSSTSKAAKPAAKAVDGSPAKRARDDDSDSRTVKKVALDSTSSVVSSKPGVKSAAGSLQSKFGAAKPRPTSTTNLAGKIRPPKPMSREPAKPEPPMVDVSSSSTPMDIDKKPPTVAPKPEPKVPAAKPAPASSSSLSSIASLLDSINTPKADSQSTQSKDSNKRDTLETAEERAKRLRKEARRKLRVSWKPETELVQVRVFHKEAEEDVDNMIKDAADDRSEGMMLKQRANLNEDDEDDDELPYQPWVEPALADLSRISNEYRNKSFVTRGGSMAFRTDEQKAMEEREKKELMVIYTDVSDIPRTPKSPPFEPATPNHDAKIVQLPQGEAKYDEIHKRWKETQQFGWEAAAYYARKRLDAKEDPATKVDSILGNLKPVAQAVTPEPYNMTPPTDNAQPVIPSATEMQPIPAVPFDEKVHGILTSERIKAWRDANPFNSSAPQTQRRNDYSDPIVQAAANAIEEIAEELRGLPYPATTPPAWLASDQERVREWWTGFQKDSAARAKKEAEDRARLEAEASNQQTAAQTQENQEAWAAYYQQQQQYAQYMALMQQMQGGQVPQPSQAAPAPTVQASQFDENQLQAILAQMGQQQPAQSATQNNAYGLNPQDTGFEQLMMLAQLQQQPQQRQSPPPAAEQSSSTTNHALENPYKPSHLQRQLVDYSDREEVDNLRDRDRGREAREGRGGKQGKNRKGNAPGGATLPPHRPVNRALIGTKPCSFWQQGKCARGDKCTFRHDT